MSMKTVSAVRTHSRTPPQLYANYTKRDFHINETFHIVAGGDGVGDAVDVAAAAAVEAAGGGDNWAATSIHKFWHRTQCPIRANTTDCPASHRPPCHMAHDECTGQTTGPTHHAFPTMFGHHFVHHRSRSHDPLEIHQTGSAVDHNNSSLRTGHNLDHLIAS